MENDSTLIVTHFRDLASKIYGMVYRDFRKSAEKLDRRKDENVFQQLQARYASELEKFLDREAKRIAEEHSSHPGKRILQRELSGHVAYLVSEFLLNAKSM